MNLRFTGPLFPLLLLLLVLTSRFECQSSVKLFCSDRECKQSIGSGKLVQSLDHVASGTPVEILGKPADSHRNQVKIRISRMERFVDASLVMETEPFQDTSTLTQVDHPYDLSLANQEDQIPPIVQQPTDQTHVPAHETDQSAGPVPSDSIPPPKPVDHHEIPSSTTQPPQAEVEHHESGRRLDEYMMEEEPDESEDEEEYLLPPPVQHSTVKPKHDVRKPHREAPNKAPQPSPNQDQPQPPTISVSQQNKHSGLPDQRPPKFVQSELPKQPEQLPRAPKLLVTSNVPEGPRQHPGNPREEPAVQDVPPPPASAVPPKHVDHSLETEHMKQPPSTAAPPHGQASTQSRDPVEPKVPLQTQEHLGQGTQPKPDVQSIISAPKDSSFDEKPDLNAAGTPHSEPTREQRPDVHPTVSVPKEATFAEKPSPNVANAPHQEPVRIEPRLDVPPTVPTTKEPPFDEKPDPSVVSTRTTQTISEPELKQPLQPPVASDTATPPEDLPKFEDSKQVVDSLESNNEFQAQPKHSADKGVKTQIGDSPPPVSTPQPSSDPTPTAPTPAAPTPTPSDHVQHVNIDSKPASTHQTPAHKVEDSIKLVEPTQEASRDTPSPATPQTSAPTSEPRRPPVNVPHAEVPRKVMQEDDRTKQVDQPVTKPTPSLPSPPKQAVEPPNPAESKPLPVETKDFGATEPTKTDTIARERVKQTQNDRELDEKASIPTAETISTPPSATDDHRHDQPHHKPDPTPTPAHKDSTVVRSADSHNESSSDAPPHHHHHDESHPPTPDSSFHCAISHNSKHLPTHLGLMQCLSAAAQLDKTQMKSPTQSPLSRLVIYVIHYFQSIVHRLLNLLPTSLVDSLDHLLVNFISLPLNFLFGWLIFVLHGIFAYHFVVFVHKVWIKLRWRQLDQMDPQLALIEARELITELTNQLTDQQESNHQLSEWSIQLNQDLAKLRQEYDLKNAEISVNFSQTNQLYKESQSELMQLKKSHQELEKESRMSLLEKDQLCEQLKTNLNQLESELEQTNQKWQHKLTLTEKKHEQTIKDLESEQEQLFNQANSYYNRMKTMQSEVEKIMDSRKQVEHKLEQTQTELESLLMTFNTLKSFEVALGNTKRKSKSSQNTNDSTDSSSFTMIGVKDTRTEDENGDGEDGVTTSQPSGEEGEQGEAHDGNDTTTHETTDRLTDPEREDDRDDETELARIKENLALFLDVGHLQAQLNIKEEQLREQERKLQYEQDLRHSLESQFELAEKENAELRSLKTTLEQEKLAIETKLEVLTDYFKDRELELQRDLGKQAIVGSESSEALNNTLRRNQELEGEIKVLRDQLTSTRKLMSEMERTNHRKISELDKRSHENWLAARSADHRVKELQEETVTLRVKLAECQRNLLPPALRSLPANMPVTSMNQPVPFSRPSLPPALSPNQKFDNKHSRSRQSLNSLSSQRSGLPEMPFLPPPLPPPGMIPPPPPPPPGVMPIPPNAFGAARIPFPRGSFPPPPPPPPPGLRMPNSARPQTLHYSNPSSVTGSSR